MLNEENQLARRMVMKHLVDLPVREEEQEKTVRISLSLWKEGIPLKAAVVRAAKKVVLERNDPKPEHDPTPWERPAFDAEKVRRQL